MPFRIHLSEGDSVPVLYPQLVLIGNQIAIVGIPPEGSKLPFYEYTVRVDLDRIVSLEPLPQPAHNSGTAS